MKTFTPRSQFIFPTHSNLTNPPKSHPISIPTTSKSIKNTLPSKPTQKHPPKTNKLTTKSPTLHSNFTPTIIPNKPSRTELLTLDEEGYSSISRNLILGAASVGFVMFLMGIDDGSKALALGPEGPLVEEFWDNMRRYGLFVLTVSTGALSAILEPIIELLKNPITAILILVIVGGGFYIVTQVVSAMIGVTDFSYEYTY